MKTRRLHKATILVAALTGLWVALAGPTAAAAAPASDPSITDTRTLHVVRINCDDEAAHFSDEIDFFVGGVWWGGKTNMDGGDWWDIKRDRIFDDSISVEIREWDGTTFGFSIIYATEAGLGTQVKHYFGNHGTNYHYRLTYWVD